MCSILCLSRFGKVAKSDEVHDIAKYDDDFYTYAKAEDLTIP